MSNVLRLHGAMLLALGVVVTAQNVSQGWPYMFETEEVFPSPPMRTTGVLAESLTLVNQLITQLTLEEKVGLVEGSDGPCGGSIAPIPRVNFKGICLQDSPLGVREADFVTMFPAGIAAGASWDRNLIYQRGLFMAEEFRAKGINIALSPVVGPLGRSAFGGRNWEGFGADPYLAGVAAKETIAGFNARGVQSTIKHWIGNEQETMRNPSTGPDSVTVLQESVSSNIDDRTMHELYMWPFADAVRAGVSHVMCSYQRLNQTYSCQNSKSLNGLLKGELGFQGAVMSDWFATHSGISSIEAGLDLNMPGSPTSPYFHNITQFIRDGNITEERLDDMVRRIMTPYFHLNQHNSSYPTLDLGLNEFKAQEVVAVPILPWKAVSAQNIEDWNFGPPKNRDVRDNHGEFVRELGAAGAVLLKNEGALPFSKLRNVAVIGNDAADLSQGQFALNNTNPVGPEFGANAVGGGSGVGRFSYFVSPLEAIKMKMGAGLTQYILDNKIAVESIGSLYPPPEACVVFVKSFTSEAYDRSTLALDWNGDAMVEEVARSCNNTVVVTHSGGTDLLGWADHPNITAIVAGHLPGQEIGNSIVDILWGNVNPSGKLPYTIAMEVSDYGTQIANFSGTTDINAWQSDFVEGQYIDYRRFDAYNITPRYEFGFGLSYTSFELEKIDIIRLTKEVSSTAPSQPVSPGGNAALYDPLIFVNVTVRNSGSVAGATVPQLYLSLPNSAPAGTPLQVLRGFEKTKVLEPDERQTIAFILTRKDMSFWEVTAQQWRVPSGDFTVRVGFSSRDIITRGSVTLI
ncbi:hypothetical protein E8E12_002364 [Didymella heteroderae]|uniref:Probable beta-glucosidase G n=1 Tax=Didymella heteroderae TaxID=1769908 RepID=A0A9P5BV26_9PLEO|nr:hypothetical protein E8E12_002364 [Didymella heteroderae]